MDRYAGIEEYSTGAAPGRDRAHHGGARSQSTLGRAAALELCPNSIPDGEVDRDEACDAGGVHARAYGDRRVVSGALTEFSGRTGESTEKQIPTHQCRAACNTVVRCQLESFALGVLDPRDDDAVAVEPSPKVRRCLAKQSRHPLAAYHEAHS